MRSTTHWRASACCGIGALSCVFLAAPGEAQVTYRVIARTGDPAPGTPHTFGSWSNVMCRAPGKVATFGTLQLSFPLYNGGIWSGAMGSMGLVALAGAPLPGTGGAVIAGMFNPSQNRHGAVIFQGRIDSGFTNDQALFLGAPGAVALLARENDVAPGTGGAVYDSQDNDPSISDSGAGAFIATLRGAGVTPQNSRAIFAGSPGALDMVARTGASPPGLPGATYSLFSPPVINSAGTVAFAANLSGAPNVGMWIKPVGGPVTPVIIPGDPAPGLAPGAVFGSAPSASARANFNDNGEIAFVASATGIGFSIWSGLPGALQLRVRPNDPAPGVPAPATFNQVGNIFLNRAGSVIYTGILNNSPAASAGIWMFTPGVGNRLVALINQQAPGMAPGVFITSFSAVITGNNAPHTLNNRGETLFYGALNYSVAQTAAFGVFAGRPGRIHKVVASGDVLEVAPGVFRTVVTPYVWTGDSPDAGRFMSINDRGEIAFFVSLVGGEFAIMLAQLPNPCPGDATGDDLIDFVDLNTILSQFGFIGPGLAGDLNGDGAVDFLDLNVVLSFFGGAC